MAMTNRTLKRVWTPADAAFGGRRSVRTFTYEAFLPDRIAALEPTLPSDVANVVTEAEVAVRAMNAAPPRLATLEALSQQLLRSESVASSRIEGLVVSHRRVARAAFDPAAADATARTVLGNIRAMEQAIALGAAAPELRSKDLAAIHDTLFRDTPLASIAGKIRTSQNWIGGSDDSPRRAQFIPPPEDRVAGLLDDLCAFVGRDDVPAIAQAAIAHAQFETIHPFADGNGRVGRCLVHAILRRRGVALVCVPPISLVLATDQPAYVRGLTTFRSYTPDMIASWVATFAQATRTAALGATDLADRIAALLARLREKAGLRRSGSAAEQLINALPSEPVLTVARGGDRGCLL
ncbi:MAG: Fic family protein [Chloroflexi bacterium]|nr:Fic family protein [Chloroflexota bacterium]